MLELGRPGVRRSDWWCLGLNQADNPFPLRTRARVAVGADGCRDLVYADALLAKDLVKNVFGDLFWCVHTFLQLLIDRTYAAGVFWPSAER
jgi:hypothetical protein